MHRKGGAFRLGEMVGIPEFVYRERTISSPLAKEKLGTMVSYYSMLNKIWRTD